MKTSKNSHGAGGSGWPKQCTRGYRRELDLGRLIPLWPSEIEDGSMAACRAIVAKLRQALRAERRRGASGHWSYDLTRHLGLKRAYCEERLRLARNMGGQDACQQKSPHPKVRANRF